MADRWMDDRDRPHRDDSARDRDASGWRRTEHEGRDGLRRYGAEPRSFDADNYQGDGGYEGGRDAALGGRSGGQAYGGQRGARTGWQDPHYGGVSPAMQRGGYGADRGPGRSYGAAGGRFYGDDAHERIYREEYGVTDFGRRDHAARDTGRRDPNFSQTRANYHAYGYGEPGFDYGYDPEMLREMRQPASGGTGGYDYERGYGDGGRGDAGAERTERFERAGRSAGDFLHRAGEKVVNWFAAGSDARAYDPDFDRPAARGLGPKGYKRSDDRISDDAHERLTDDHWLDATEITVSVSAGEVTLSGAVPSREAKHRAERIVENISGVHHVQNNLRLSRGGLLTGDSTGYGDSVAEAQMRKEEPGTTGRKN